MHHVVICTTKTVDNGNFVSFLTDKSIYIYINAVIYNSTLVMYSSEIIEIHFFKSFILTAVYDLQ